MDVREIQKHQRMCQLEAEARQKVRELRMQQMARDMSEKHMRVYQSRTIVEDMIRQTQAENERKERRMINEKMREYYLSVKERSDPQVKGSKSTRSLEKHKRLGTISHRELPAIRGSVTSRNSLENDYSVSSLRGQPKKDIVWISEMTKKEEMK